MKTRFLIVEPGKPKAEVQGHLLVDDLIRLASAGARFQYDGRPVNVSGPHVDIATLTATFVAEVLE